MEGDVRQSSNLFQYFDGSSSGSPLREKAQSVQHTLQRVTNKGACFFCNEEGHWVRDCPRRSNPSPGSGSPMAGRRTHPEMHCPCGYGACIVRTSQTVYNPDRDFYRCPAKQNEQCSFFKWCDEAASGQIPMLKSPVKPYQEHDGINTLAKPAGHLGLKSPMKHGKHLNDTDLPNPMCSCGAGKCILVIVHDGENAGRKYFACPIKKGQGACNHFQWYESSTTKASEIEQSDCLLYKPNLPTLGNMEACKAINVVKEKDKIAPVSPLLQDQIFLREPQASTRENGLRDPHNFIGQGAYNHFQLYGITSKASVIENSDCLLDKPNSSTLDNKEDCKVINIVEEEDMVVPVSPLRQDQSRRDDCLQISPLKRLSLGDARRGVGSSKHKRGMKFGDDGHWLNEFKFNASPTYPCFKCGRFGHSKHNCQA